MILGFEQTSGRSKKRMDMFWGLEEKVISENENILNFLSTKKGVWLVSEGQILFYNDEDLKKMNSYLESIQRLGEQQEELQIQSSEIINQKLQSLKEEINR